MWIPYWSQQAGLSAVLGHSGLFSTVSPFWYDARGGPAITRDPGGGDAAVVRRLRARGLAVVPTVASSMPPAVATRVLGATA